ncbi:MAG: transcription-repair coupling factor [Bdellovibrionota bacterium]
MINNDKNNKNLICYYGLQGSASPYIASKLLEDIDNATIICKDKNEAEKFFIDLKFFSDRGDIYLFPEWDTLHFEQVSPQKYISASRISILNDIKTLKSHVVITTPRAIMQKIVSFEKIKQNTFCVKVGSVYNRQAIIHKLVKNGFNKVSLVENNAEFSVRGNVIDLFPANINYGVRLLFLEDTLEKIKIFAPETQLTINQVKEFEILPTREFFFPDEDKKDKAKERIFKRAHELNIPINDIRYFEQVLGDRISVPGLEMLQALYEPLDDYFSYIENDENFFIKDSIDFENNLNALEKIISEREERLLEEKNLIPRKKDLYLSSKEIALNLKNYKNTYLESLFVDTNNNVKSYNLKIYKNTELKIRIRKSLELGTYKGLVDYINKLRNGGASICFVIQSDTRIRRLQKILLDFDIEAKLCDISPHKWIKLKNKFGLAIIKSSLTEGFHSVEEKVVFVSESEIFGDKTFSSQTRKTISAKKLMSSLSALKEDDYIVHEDYGVGIYRGLKHIKIEEEEADFIEIDYLDSKLFLPVTSIKKIEKFVAGEGQEPTLDKLSSRKWLQTKSKIRSAVFELAGDLIRLYKDREIARGWSFSKYNLEDDTFADGFGYKETKDQLDAINDSLKDMASLKPMDRLICGDVGFGKTEVALRCAFKCIQDKKQVAVLVPTTILVEQHFSTFLKRFANYPVKVGAISRFYSARENKATLEKLSTGKLDIIIGTHSLLQKDVAFKDLGLLVIDEEHRFGVKQKEKIKQMKRNVDVLTLTATPIPRTLNMAMLNIRDISLISTPPCNRQVIRTYISTFKESTIRDAILREIERGGQVFFIHNKIQSIEAITDRLKLLVPEARFEFAHGQMLEKNLEDITKRFFDHEFDVLVSTTIVENGVDLPNANTIIIDRADTFGLSQLYQLRGRVGRSDRQAYAYFIIPEIKKMTATAKERLNVIQSLDDLGVGFNLAVRDLEIRGAGNLLGKEQSGNVVKVGFELYTKILQEVVSEISGDELSVEDIVEPEIKTPFPAFISEYYLPDVAQRLILYQRIATIKTREELESMYSEIEDRFGPVPEETVNLLKTMEFRSKLKRLGVVSINIKNETLVLSFSPKANIDIENIVHLVQSDSKKYRFSQSQNLSITHGLSIEKNSIDDFFNATNKVLLRILR